MDQPFFNTVLIASTRSLQCAVFYSRVCRPVFKEFDDWPEISLEPDPPREKKEKKESPENQTNINLTQQITTSQK